ncbi:MAG: dihydrolipoamide acetyltransferase family protein [Cyanobium sp.]
MATHEIFMPALSSTMTEGKIVEWLKKPGDKVERGESVLVVESDKADMDVESFNEGFLAAVLMPSGGTAPVGETIGLIVETEAEIAAVAAKAPAAPAAAAPAAPAPAPVAPAPVAAPAAVAAPPAPLAPAPPEAVIAAAAASSPAAAAGRVVASPRARKLAAQLGVALEALRGSGPNGRIQAEDVEQAAGQPVSIPRIAEGSAAAMVATVNGVAPKVAASAPIGQSFGAPGETVTFTTLQQAVVRNMNASLTVPCFHVGYTITTDKLDALYKQIKSKGVTMTALLAKAVGVTLARHPQVNAAAGETTMTYPGRVNVAVAVAMEDGGLITPVLADADRTDLYSLSRNWADLVSRARSKQLKPEEYSTGTFTLSNLGMFGVDRFDAILPPGTGAILAVAASRPTVVATREGAITVKRQMQVNLTADHRVIYGTHAAAFLKDLAELIETNPETLVL